MKSGQRLALTGDYMVQQASVSILKFIGLVIKAESHCFIEMSRHLDCAICAFTTFRGSFI